MRSHLIIGEKTSREEFILNFIQTEKIAPYAITYFSEQIQTEDAKKIRKLLSKKYSEKTLFVINSINHVAQNSLLKNIEEPSENIAVIISVDNLSEILDTIKSRLFIVDLSSNSNIEDKEFLGCLSSNITEKNQTLDKFILENAELTTEEQVKKFIILYRNTLIENLKSFNARQIRHHVFVLKRLFFVTNLIRSNNVNLRFALESTIY